ncbi:hypothetical protein SLA2020_055730 [Shorea laevis]
MLLIPSLTEALADDSEGLASSKESALKEMQEMATRMFIKGKKTSEEKQNMTAEAENRRRQQQKELQTNSNNSPLARFLLSKWQSQVSKDLNPA